MALLQIEADDMVLQLGRWERVGSLRRRDVRLPLSAVIAVRDVEDAYAEVRGIRAPGTGWPGKILLGTFRYRGRKDFCAVYERDPGVVVEFRDEDFARLVVTGIRPAGLELKD